MTTLDSFENAEVPGVGQTDLTSPKAWIGLTAGATALFLAVGGGRWAANQVKSVLGTNDFQIPQVGDV